MLELLRPNSLSAFVKAIEAPIVTVSGASRKILYLALLVMIGFSGCKSDNPTWLFTNLNSSSTNVEFSNDLNIADSINILNYIYAFNGGGVGIGDLNNDGLEDLVFAGNQVSSKVYLNLGDFEFKDITHQSGLETTVWCTGVSLVDINSDGYLDIYFSVAGSPNTEERKNLLYINDGALGFNEQAEAWGIADTNYSTQSAFFDYDRDGDLDLYVLNHANDRTVLNTPLPKKLNGESPSTDILYRNNGDQTFTDVSREAGITIEGYGLGVAISDLNNDSWPDIYISNDFISNDLLYINNGDGTFENVISSAIQEQSYNGMGNDVADINNDGHLDIMVMDMLSSDPVDEKMMAGSMTYDKFSTVRAMDYEDQFVRNTLQLNQSGLNFTEIGRYAGVHRTDWSWAPLLADFDNDGWKDIYITNGYLRDITNKDYIDYTNNLSMFKPVEQANRETLERMINQSDLGAPNFSFRNKGDLTFANTTASWTDNATSFSNGAAYGDLDNDGDLDLVVNNINAPASLLRNESSKESNYLQVVLKGSKLNPDAIGAMVYVTNAAGQQWTEQSTSRGFMSTVSSVLHFGLGVDTVVHTLEVSWPDGKHSIINNLNANQRIVVDYTEASESDQADARADAEFGLIDITEALAIKESHLAPNYADFKQQPLFPYRRSSDGLELVSGDFDGDGNDDLFVCNIDRATLYYQESDGSFNPKELYKESKELIIDAISADINGDQLDDLVLLSHIASDPQQSSVQLWVATTDRKFINGNAWLPSLSASVGAISIADYDDDGNQDLLISTTTGSPYQSQLKLLRNDGETFIDVSSDMLPKLPLDGIIKELTFTDYSGDGLLDIIVAGEWMPIIFLVREGEGYVEDYPVPEWSNLTGWWRSIAAEDMDGDGDVDLIVGNSGLNSGYETSPEFPAKLNLLDIDQDKFPEAMMTSYVNGIETLQPTREVLIRRYPFLARLFPNHMSYAQENPTELINQNNPLKTLTSQTGKSYYLENIKGQFTPYELPGPAQLFPMGEILLEDYSGDGKPQILLAGGISVAETDGRSYGRADPVLLSIDDGQLSPQVQLAFHVGGDITSIAKLKGDHDQWFIAVAIRNVGLKIFRNYGDKIRN